MPEIAVIYLSVLPFISVFNLPPPESEGAEPMVTFAEAVMERAEKAPFASDEARETIQEAQRLLEEARKAVKDHEFEDAAALASLVPLTVRLARLVEDAVTWENKAEAKEVEARQAVEMRLIARHALDAATEQLKAGPATLADEETPLSPPSALPRQNAPPSAPETGADEEPEE